MRIVLMVLGVLVAVVAIVIIVGFMLPVKHHVTRQVVLPVAPDSVFALISDVAGYPAWRPSVGAVEIGGPNQFRETSGGDAILYSVEVDDRPTRRVTRIADKSLPFGGSWTYDVSPAPNGSVLRITEDGEVYNPVFRFMSRFVFSHSATIETYLKDLSAKVGATARIGE